MTDGLKYLYRQVAPIYETQILPAIAPLARDLANWIIACLDAHLRYELHDPFDLELSSQPINIHALRAVSAIDIGTGTGVLARTLAKTLQGVAGIDLSPEMLAAGRSTPLTLRNGDICFAVGDLHDLPVRSGAVMLVASSFGLNTSTPKIAFRSIARILAKRGMFTFTEWGAEDDVSRLIDALLDEHTPESFTLDPTLAKFYAQPRPWYDHLQDRDDFYEMLKKAGFDLVWVREETFTTVTFPTLDQFITYKLSWPERRAKFNALPNPQCFMDTLHSRITTNPDGSFDWSPPLFRVCAIR